MEDYAHKQTNTHTCTPSNATNMKKRQTDGWKRRKAEIPKSHFSQNESQAQTSKNGGFTWDNTL